MMLYGSLALLSSLLHLALAISINVYPNIVNPGNSSAKFVSGPAGLDGPKVAPPNGTSYDWWYFDAVSADSNASIVIIFYVATSDGFPFLAPGSALSVNFFATFENGTSLVYFLEDLPSNTGAATVITDGNGSSGYWNSTGAKWIGTPDVSGYVVTIDSPKYGIKGSLILDSVSSGT
jgi:hypothetical protein